MFIRQNFRLYPNKSQSTTLNQWIGQARFVWNYMLNKNIEKYSEEKKFIFAYEMHSLLPTLKKSEEFAWLKECPSQVLQQKCQDLDTALKNKFKHKRGFPKFKSKNTDRSGIRFPQGIEFTENKLILPKMKSGIKFVKHREFLGEPGAVTIYRDSVGDYYVSVLVKVSDDFTPELVKDITSSVGIDLGLKEFAVLSDGTNVTNPRFKKNLKRKMTRVQREFSRKQKNVKGEPDKKNREKSRIKLAKLHRKIANQRKNFVNQTAASIAKKYDLITIESLNIKGMVKNHCLAGSISDAGWGMFMSALEWQCEKRGKHLHKIDRWFPSSKTCNACGSIKQTLTLADRVFKCDDCGHEMDRDLNAALNIDQLGRNKYGLNDRNQRLLDMKNGGGNHMVSDTGSSEQEAQLPCAVG